MKQISMMDDITELIRALTVKNNFSFCKYQDLHADIFVTPGTPEGNLLKAENEFFKSLLTRGLTKANVNGLGIQTTLEGRVVGSGRPIPLYALD